MGKNRGVQGEKVGARTATLTLTVRSSVEGAQIGEGVGEGEVAPSIPGSLIAEGSDREVKYLLRILHC